jgi:hypothetical protein
LSQLGITSDRARVYNLWTESTTTLSAVSVTLEAGQTELVQIIGA